MSGQEEFLFQAPKCHVFRLPPSDQLKSEAWEGGHIFTGRIGVVRTRVPNDDGTLDGASHFIRLEDDAGALFGECPLSSDPDAPASLQPASDSLRCFVLRIVSGDRHAFIGINFEERGEAFNFRTVAMDSAKYARGATTLPVQERTLVGKIHVDLTGKIKAPATTATSATAGPVGGSGLVGAGARPGATTVVSLDAPIPVGAGGTTNRRRLASQSLTPTGPLSPAASSPPYALPTVPPAVNAGAALLGQPLASSTSNTNIASNDARFEAPAAMTGAPSFSQQPGNRVLNAAPSGSAASISALDEMFGGMTTASAASAKAPTSASTLDGLFS